MIAYVDSSIVLRIVLGQQNSLSEWSRIVTAVTSRLLEVECFRTLDRLRLLGQLDHGDLALRREAVYRILEAVEVVELSGAVMHRAAQPMAAPLGTLDAMHLATAELWREMNSRDLVMATHDKALALAARGNGMRVVGV